MRTNAAGLELIKAHEGLRLDAYICPAGKWTIGYGHTSAAGAPRVKPGMRITAAEAEEILARDLAVYETAVENAVTVLINANQFAALVSFCFNVGPGAFRSSSALRVLNEGKYDEVPARLALWNKATVNGQKVVLKGLVKRRKAEGELFMRDAMAVHVPPQQPDDPGVTDPPQPRATGSLIGWLVAGVLTIGAAVAAYFGWGG